MYQVQKRFLVVLGVGLSLIFKINAQTYRFQDAGLIDKLPNPQVTAILQDKFGYMWFGTRNGLVRYDGINTEVFQFEVNPFRQDKNRPVVVTALTEAKNGDIWVGTENGELARFDRIRNILTPLDIGPKNKDLYKPSPIIIKNHFNVVKNNFSQQVTDSLLSQGQIIGIHGQANGNLWVGNHNSGGFFKVVPDTNTFQQRSIKAKEILWYSEQNKTTEKVGGRPFYFWEDDKNNIWMTTTRGLVEVHPEPISTQLYQLYPDKTHNWLNKFADIVFLDSIIVMGSFSTGVIVFNRATKKVENFLEPYQSANNFQHIDKSAFFFRTPENYPEGKIQASPAKCFFYHPKSGGIWTRLLLFPENKAYYTVFDPHTKKYRELNLILDLGDKVVQNPFFDLVYQDKSGTIWASNQNGIFKVSQQSTSFEWYQSDLADPKSLKGNQVNGIYAWKGNQYWVATDYGLNHWFKDENHFKSFPFEENYFLYNGDYWYRKTQTIFDLMPISEKELWLATNLTLEKFDISNGDFQPDQIDKTLLKKLFNQSYEIKIPCFAIEKDKKGNLWLGNKAFLFYHITKTNQTLTYTFPGFHFLYFLSTHIRSLVMDPEENLWIGTFDKGMYCLHSNEIPEDSEVIPMEAFESFEFEGALPRIIDSRGNLWATSPASGVIKINLETRQVTQYTTSDGLAHDNTFNIIEDNQQRIWIGTFNGLSCFDPGSNSFQNYYKSDGLPTNIINGNKSCKTNDGSLIIPSNKGIITFHPENILKNKVPPPVVFTAFKVDNEQLPIAENSPLHQHISLTRQITLEHFQNDITIEFAALHYGSQEKNQYAVFMENDEADWRKIGNQHAVTYTNMAPGKYKFHVKAANSDEVWTKEPLTLSLIILPPWWATWWAYSIYLISFISISYFIYRFQLNRKLEKAENNRLLELDEFKSRFYTNITHEFRTPLTLILGTSQELLYEKDNQVRNFAQLLKRNSLTLLNLVNQLLDLSKLRSNALNLDLVQADIIQLVKIVLEPFYHEAASKGLTLTFDPHPDQLLMDFDQEKLRQIIYNLVSNAIKFTNEGFIEIHLEKRMQEQQAVLMLSVEDTGIGIAPETQPKIFDHFYQGDNSSTRKYEGSGIGLALAKELLTLMKGRITVTSTLGKGSTFMVEIPITNTAEIIMVSPALLELPVNPNGKDKTGKESTSQNGLESKKKTAFSALVIEDNPDLRSFLSMKLENYYKIFTANNGKTGIEKAIKLVPDVVICDVMMPNTDGFQVCEKLKLDEKTSHIPIVLLTAKTEMKDRLKGLKLGADAYLTKPFNKEELLITIEKCIALRLKLRERYVKLGPYNPTIDKTTQLNDNFLIKLNKVIEDNLHSEVLSSTFIARELGVSKSQIYRKLQTMTGKSITSYIRFFRFELAKKLLENTDKTISEISYDVGFNNPSYFTRKFHEEFGITPSKLKNDH